MSTRENIRLIARTPLKFYKYRIIDILIDIFSSFHVLPSLLNSGPFKGLVMTQCIIKGYI